MGITFGPKNSPPETPALFGNQVQSLVNKTSDLTFRLEKLEFVYKRIFDTLCDTLDRIKALEQHALWERDSARRPKKSTKKPLRKQS